MASVSILPLALVELDPSASASLYEIPIADVTLCLRLATMPLAWELSLVPRYVALVDDLWVVAHMDAVISSFCSSMM